MGEEVKKIIECAMYKLDGDMMKSCRFLAFRISKLNHHLK